MSTLPGAVLERAPQPRSRLRSLPIVLGISLGVALFVSTEAARRSMFDAFNELVGRPGVSLEILDRLGIPLRGVVWPLSLGLGMSEFVALLVGICLAYDATSIAVARWRARPSESIGPAVVRAPSGVERTRLPFAPLLAAGAALLAASQLGSLGTNVAAGTTSLACSVLGAACATPALVVSLRYVLVRPVEGLLGVPGRLGLDYVERTLGRSTVNVVALMVAVGMSVGVGGLLASFQRSLSDYFEQRSPEELTVIAGSGVKEMLNQASSYSHAVEWVTLLVALIGMASTMIAAVLDRQREIGALRAIGATRGQMATTMVVEAGFLALCAVIGGVGLGMLQATLFIRTLLVNDTAWHLPFVFPWLNAARIALLSLLTSMLAGGVAAYLASRADVMGSVAHE